MHINAAHLHSHMGQPPVNATAVANKRAEEMRKRLFAAAEDLDTAATEESAWMIGAWSGSGDNGQRHGNRGEESWAESNTEKNRAIADREAAYRAQAARQVAPDVSSDLAEEQSAVAGAQALGAASAQTAPAVGYAAYATPLRVERAPEAKQVSYWA